jgi:transposase InsO family protein
MDEYNLTRQTKINGKVIEYDCCLSGMTAKEAIKEQENKVFSHYVGSSHYWRVEFREWFKDKEINHFFSRPPKKVKTKQGGKTSHDRTKF